MPGRMKASNVAEAAFMPGVSEKRSTANPSTNAHASRALRGVSESIFNIK